jgi:YVTN family beta-propeller protein
MPYLLTEITLPGGSHPHGVAVNGAGDRLYVTLHGDAHTGRSLAVLDGLDWHVSGSVDLAETATGPNGVALLNQSGRVIVANRQTSNASVIDVAPAVGNSQVISTIAASLQPNGVAVSGDFGYIANYGSDSITVFDPTTLAVIRTLNNAGKEPSLFAVDPTNGDVYVSAHGSDEVARLRNGHVSRTYANIVAPYGLAFDPVSRYLYIANRGKAHTVTILDTASGNVVGAIPVVLEPFVLAVNPDSGHLFITFGDQVRVLRTRDWSLVTSFGVPAGAEEGIALHSESDRIFVTSGDGDAVTILQDSWPAEIVYASAGTQTELYSMLPDASLNTRLAKTTGIAESEPVGSPDGRWIAYVRREEGKTPEIWRMGRNGQNQQPLVQNFGDLASPAWSPDGTRLLFASQNDGDWELYTIPVNGGAIARLTDNSADDLSPDWAWFTDRIVFVSNRVGPNPEVYSMLSDGSDVRRLSVNPNGDATPRWSPDGTQIVFASTRDSVQSLFVMQSNGSDIRQLVEASLRPFSPAWSPDGGFIAFAGYRPGSGHSELFRINPDGTGLRLLTHNELESDFGPGWLPGK